MLLCLTRGRTMKSQQRSLLMCPFHPPVSAACPCPSLPAARAGGQSCASQVYRACDRLPPRCRWWDRPWGRTRQLLCRHQTTLCRADCRLTAASQPATRLHSLLSDRLRVPPRRSPSTGQHRPDNSRARRDRFLPPSPAGMQSDPDNDMPFKLKKEKPFKQMPVYFFSD